VVADAPKPADFLSETAEQHFEAVRRGLEALSIPYTLDGALVRGLDYYNRTVWEYVPTTYDAAQSSVGGGGRYDGLFENLGGKPTPAVGLAMGVDRILLASGRTGADTRLDAFVIVASKERRPDARQLVSDLRIQHLRVDMTDMPRSVKAQFKEANRAGAGAAVIVGEEWTSGHVAVKNLETGEQQEIPIKEIGRWLQA